MSSPRRKLARAAHALVVLVIALVPAVRPLAAPDADQDGDGLPDAWETSAGRAYGCDPRHADLLVYAVSRTTMDAKVNETIARATAFFDALDVPNPDGRRGIRLHVIRGPHTTRTENYPDLMAIYLPPALKGRAHFHVFSDAPGGQTTGVASISGVADIGWNSFVHELGHHLGLEHEARGFKIQSPMHASLMNYAYEVTFNGTDQVQFSNGRFARYRMRENDLDETLPFPIASLGFLAQEPYRFRLKADGERTQVDWNRNGIFGEKGVRADINYATGTWLGERHDVEPAATAPVAAYEKRDLFLAFGVTPGPHAEAMGARHAIVVRKLVGDNRWGPRVATGLVNTVGDPTMVAYHGLLWVAAATMNGVAVSALQPGGDGARIDPALGARFPSRVGRLPTLAVLGDRLFLFVHEGGTNRVVYRVYSGTGNVWGAEQDTRLRSRTPPGVAWHPIRRQAVLVFTEDANAKYRLKLYYRGVSGDRLDDQGDWDWIGGADGANASSARPAVFVDTSRDAGPAGRVYAYYQASLPGLPAFLSMQVADRTFHGGWLERSAYDEWSTTASAPAAIPNPDGDITYCYRDQSSGVVKCSFGGSGVQPEEMGDADELTFIRQEGLRRALGR